MSFKPAFRGCVILPMTDDDADLERLRYYGHWAYKQSRDRIIGKPRRYQLTFYFKGVDGERGVEQLRVLDKIEFLGLAAIVHNLGNEMLETIGKDKVDLMKSYVSIRA